MRADSPNVLAHAFSSSRHRHPFLAGYVREASSMVHPYTQIIMTRTPFGVQALSGKANSTGDLINPGRATQVLGDRDTEDQNPHRNPPREHGLLQKAAR